MNRVKKILRTIRDDSQLMFGCIGICIMLLMIVLAPVITRWPGDYYGPDSLAAPGVNGHILGTSHMGQDVWSMVVCGIRTSLKVAVVSACISGLIGIVVGGVAGYFGGIVDRIVSEIINVFMMLPTLFLVLLVVSLFGNSIFHVMVVIGLTTWPSNAKLMRAQALSLRQRTFVISARTMGETKLQILFRYIIPNGIFPVISNTTMRMAGAILTEASLSFLGLGDPTVVSWGQMVYDGKAYMTQGWWVCVFAGLAIVLTVLVFYMMGDGINHVLNPKYAKGGKK